MITFEQLKKFRKGKKFYAIDVCCIPENRSVYICTYLSKRKGKDFFSGEAVYYYKYKYTDLASSKNREYENELCSEKTTETECRSHDMYFLTIEEAKTALEWFLSGYANNLAKELKKVNARLTKINKL